MAISVSVTSSTYRQGNGLQVTLTDSLTGNSANLEVLERVVGVGFFTADPEMLTRVIKDVCTAVNSLASTPAAVQDAG